MLNRRYKYLAALTLGGALFLGAEVCLAGGMVNFGAQWRAHAFAPEASESTPNYYGIGPYLGLGWSLGSIVDLNLFTRYSPSQLENADVGKESAQIYSYGVEFGFRIARAFYLGFRGGMKSYELFAAELPEELEGRWQGPGGGFSIGGLVRTGKRSFLQVTFDIGSANLTYEKAEEGAGPRRMDWFGLTLSFCHIGLDRLRLDNVALGDWLNL